MFEGASILVAALLILFTLRWVLGVQQPNQPQSQQQATATRIIHRVTPQMVDMVRTMFPHLPTATITADLQRTGSVETTVDNAIRAGGLPAPLATTPGSQQPDSSDKRIQHCNLLQRYNLAECHLIKDDLSEPPKFWESDALKRQEALRKRKEYMVLQARKKLMEQQKPQSINPLPLHLQDTPTERQQTEGVTHTLDCEETTSPTYAPSL